MSSIGVAATSMHTPMSRPHASQSSGSGHTKRVQELNSLRLSLNCVVGTTTDSVNAFDALPQHHTFVCCAGSAAVLTRVDEHLDVTQQLFRVRPNTSAINVTPSFYNPATPPSALGKIRHESPLKDRGSGITYNGLQDYPAKSPSQSKAKDRSKEASCVSLSRTGNLLAVGEIGYRPRVLIFSTASDRLSDVPLSILSDHSFGISSVAFSDDSRWLCTLGNSYDGFIIIYSINAKTGSAKLHSSNKCSNVHSVIWMGHSVVSIGVRHAKVWRTPISASKTRLELDNVDIGSSKSPAPKAFAGRNCLLGPLVDVTFTSVVAISDCWAILCTAQGDICVLDDSQQTQRLERVAQVAFSILCVTLDHAHGLVWVGGRHGAMKSIHIDALIKPTVHITSPITTAPFSSSGLDMVPDIIAIGIVRGRVVFIDSHRIIEIRGLIDMEGASVMQSDSRRLPAHESAVLGVSEQLSKTRADSPDLLTFSARGTVLFWLVNGACTGSTKIPLDQPVYLEDGETNDLKTVVPLGSDQYLLSGDKIGVLRLIDRFADKEVAIQAHNGDINVRYTLALVISGKAWSHDNSLYLKPSSFIDCSFIIQMVCLGGAKLTPRYAQSIAVAFTEGSTVVATCGRDRTVQLFRQHELHLDLLQTLDDHAAAVGDVKFLDRTTLLSISSDRTIFVRKLARGQGQPIAFLPNRVITLKASPVSLTALHAQPNVVLVSTFDRQILKYNVSSGRLLHSFKASDPTTGDSLLMSSLQIHELDQLASPSRLIVGVSSTDRSIRVHEYDSGIMLTSEYGHNAVSAVRLIRSSVEGESYDHLVSCGLDGTVMTWDLSLDSRKSSAFRDISRGIEPSSNPILPPTQPPRRILSKAEVSNLQKSWASESNTTTPIRGSSPSRVRRTTSKYGLAATPKISGPAPPLSADNPLSSTHASIQYQLSQCYSTGYSPTLSSQKDISKSRLKPPALDSPRRSKSAADLNDLNDLGKQICVSLRTFRSRIKSSSVAKLGYDAIPELTKELNLTVRALNDKVISEYISGPTLEGDILDGDSATIIGSKSAMEANSNEKTFVDGQRSEAKGFEELTQTNAGESEESLG